jgi:hypothetical protein
VKAITVQQPWAWAIAEGHKPVENRGQVTHHLGPIAIHAGLKVADASLPDREACVALDRAGGRGNVWDPRRFPPPLRPASTMLPTLAVGAVIAVAELVDCHPAVSIPAMPGHPEHTCCAPWGDALYETKRGPVTAWHLVLTDVKRLREPVPCRGEVRVPWELPEDVAAEVDGQLAEAVTP